MTKPLVGLTAAEWAVVNAMKNGCDTVPKIAAQTQFPVGAVRISLRRIYREFGVGGMRELGRIVYETVQAGE